MNRYDAIIIGGGPGGSTTGTFLAKAGKKVLILEREHFPRFHVGESLIPYINDVLIDSGVWDKVASAGFMVKPGAEFTLGNSQGIRRFWFGRNLAPRYAETFQVERARFDKILFEHACECGCEGRQGARVHTVEVTGDGVSVEYETGAEKMRAEAKWIIDASGRDAFLGKAMNLPKTDLGLPRKFATFAHFHNVRRNEGKAEGNITIVRLEQGWFWIIPLDKEKTSVGLVQTLDQHRKSGLKPGERFEQVVAGSTELLFRMKGAQRVSDFYHAGDYTYRHLTAAGPRWILVGDAAGFIDPIFSSGVMLSLKSGRLAAREILKAERRGGALSAGQQRWYTGRIRQMTNVFLNMIKMFYDNDAFEVFMNPAASQELIGAVNNLVGGNTDLGWRLRWRVWVFYMFCRLQKKWQMVPRLNFDDKAAA
ncbi:MAG: NAD(P)/FAD-dependent oxidoreductase [Methylacidiphilales bacterium]|nr:NAD(P)/FAD-dependent oxidoreductase [Candidatus Methylacidiphilales bacterium]